jgi:hypothetical protein
MNVWTADQLSDTRIRVTDVSRIRRIRRTRTDTGGHEWTQHEWTQKDATAVDIEYGRTLEEPAGHGRTRDK